MGALRIKQSTSIDVPIGPFVDSTDGNTVESGLTITQPDIRLKKNGGAWAQKSAAQTLSHEEAGWYEVTLDATDTDTLGHLVVAIHESGALPCWREFEVVPANVYDSLVAGSDKIETDVAQFGGTNGTFASGIPEVKTASIAAGAVNAAAIATDAIDADALKADAVTEIQAGLSTLDAAGVRAAVGLAGANLDTQLAAIAAFIDTEIAAMPDSVWDEAVEGAVTARQLMRGFAAALLAKCSGLETTNASYRDLADTKDRITATVDADGNRSAVSRDLT